jgi:hypothetical protein
MYTQSKYLPRTPDTVSVKLKRPRGYWDSDTETTIKSRSACYKGPNKQIALPLAVISKLPVIDHVRITVPYSSVGISINMCYGKQQYRTAVQPRTK